MRLDELSSKIVLLLYARVFNFFEFFYVLFRFYIFYPRYALIDLCLILSYFYKSPYRIDREYREKNLLSYEPYGETPLSTMYKLARAAGITNTSYVYELGAGRGRTSFFLSEVLGAKTVGVDYNPEFIERAQNITSLFHLEEHVHFICRDMKTIPLDKATVVYLYGTTLADIEIIRIAKQCTSLKQGSKLITISYSMLDFVPDMPFEIEQVVAISFPWGKTEAYIHRRI